MIAMMANAMPFSGNPLDRAHNLRHDDAWMEEQLASPRGRFLLFSKLEVLAHQSAPALVWLTPDQRVALASTQADPVGALEAPLALPFYSQGDVANGHEAAVLPEPILLGLQDGAPRFALDVTSIPGVVSSLGLEGAAFADPRGLAAVLPASDCGIIAQARTLIDWHAHHRFCSLCGAPTAPHNGGAERKCATCGGSHFPRVNPAVIMVVEHEDRCLLGRRRGRPAGNFSCVAGYVDPGESIEEAVAREVFEEVGMEVDRVTYFASQPWPFSSSLMIGCFAHSPSAEPHVDELEIEEARWFSRDDVRRAVAGDNSDLIGGNPVAISYHLIRGWAEQGG